MHAAALDLSHCPHPGQFTAEASSATAACLWGRGQASSEALTSASNSGICQAFNISSANPTAAVSVSTNPNIASPSARHCPVHSLAWPQPPALPPSPSQTPTAAMSTFGHASSEFNYDWTSNMASALQPSYIDPRQMFNASPQYPAFACEGGHVSLPTSTAPSPYIHHVATPQSCPDPSGSPFPDGSQLLDAGEIDPQLPYNQLLFKCLLGAPNHEMLLKDIYRWFTEHTDKGQNPKSKGWMNSIRHNLSMNPAFIKGSRSQPGTGATNMWSLTEEAIQSGVEPTTRFRNCHGRAGSQRGRRAAAPTPHGAVRTLQTPWSAELEGPPDASLLHPHRPRSPSTFHRPDYRYHPYRAYSGAANDDLIETVGGWQGPPMPSSIAGGVQPDFLHAGLSSVPVGSTNNLFQDEGQSQVDPRFFQIGTPALSIATPWTHVDVTQAEASDRAIEGAQVKPVASVQPNAEQTEVAGYLGEAKDGPLFASDNETTSLSDHSPKTPPLDLSRLTYGPEAKPLQAADADFHMLFNSPAV